MKKVILCVSALMMFLSANAQEEQSRLRHRGFETNRFIDNWEISAGVGGQLYERVRGNDVEGRFNRMTFGFNVSAGKWITPIFGARLQYQGISMTTYQLNKTELNWNYHFLHADAMVNLTNWICGYKADRLYNAILVGGFGWARSVFDEPESHNDEFAATFGLINRFRLCDAWSLNLELKATALRHSFDGISVSDKKVAAIADATVGATWRIPTKRDFDMMDRTQFTNKIAALEKDVADGNKTIGEQEDEISRLKRTAADAEKARKAAEEAARNAKAVYAPTPNQALSIFFRIGQSEITDKNQENLKFLAEAIKNSDKNDVFVVTGYADKETGSEEFNNQLSKERGEAVRDALIGYGVPSDKVQVEYRGSSVQPFSGKAYMNRVAIINKTAK